jgi:hypothetical protein
MANENVSKRAGLFFIDPPPVELVARRDGDDYEDAHT